MLRKLSGPCVDLSLKGVQLLTVWLFLVTVVVSILFVVAAAVKLRFLKFRLSYRLCLIRRNRGTRRIGQFTRLSYVRLTCMLVSRGNICRRLCCSSWVILWGEWLRTETCFFYNRCALGNGWQQLKVKWALHIVVWALAKILLVSCLLSGVAVTMQAVTGRTE